MAEQEEKTVAVEKLAKRAWGAFLKGEDAFYDPKRKSPNNFNRLDPDCRRAQIKMAQGFVDRNLQFGDSSSLGLGGYVHGILYILYDVMCEDKGHATAWNELADGEIEGYIAMGKFYHECFPSWREIRGREAALFSGLKQDA